MKITVFAEMKDLLNVALAVIVARMRLAGKNELNRPFGISSELHDFVQLVENKRCAFVGRESPGETNGQGVRIQQAVERDKVLLGPAVNLNKEPPARELNQFTTQFVTQRP